LGWVIYEGEYAKMVEEGKPINGVIYKVSRLILGCVVSNLIVLPHSRE
jgi:hypothetical protein